MVSEGSAVSRQKTERDSNADSQRAARRASCCRSGSPFPRSSCASPGGGSHLISSDLSDTAIPPVHDAMPSFFDFQLGSDSHVPETESLRYGRFRALQVPKRSVGELFSAFGLHADDLHTQRWAGGGYSYGSISITTSRGGAEESEEGEEGERWWLDKMLISPRRRRVVKLVDQWWGRLGLLVVLPAAIVVAWCAIPFPTYPIPADDVSILPAQYNVLRRYGGTPGGTSVASIPALLIAAARNVFDFSVLRDALVCFLHRLSPANPPEHPLPDDGGGSEHLGGGGGGPGHGEALVTLNFWFFLVVYYGFYNLIGLLWITKLFNLYSLNWWPARLGFSHAFTLFNLLPLLIAVPMYFVLPAAIINHNLTWILLTFTTMLSPVLISFLMLLFERRAGHLGRRSGPSDTQLLFSTTRHFDPPPTPSWRKRVQPRTSWGLAQSYVRFIWFGSALLLSLVALVLGEAYAEVYLRTLPHTSLETVLYVWSWVATIHLLDGTTGWILGARVGSYPLGFVFKLYFCITYQTYVRALYARLRSPSQFAYLQLLSSSIVIIWQPLSMTRAVHTALVACQVNGQTYEEYKKFVGRSFWLRGLAENVSMLAWLGWVVGLHYGWNTRAYPYFSFSDKEDPYTFQLTFYASLATWACEILAGWVVRRIMQWWFRFSVTEEAVQDLVQYPELVPACLAVMIHVLQNMLFSIIRLRFY